MTANAGGRPSLASAGGLRRPELRLRCAPGFTVVELLVTVAIIMTISAIAIPNLMAAMDHVKVARAMGDMRTIGDGVMGYSLVNGSFPNTLADVGYGELNDPWGAPYQYLKLLRTSKERESCVKIASWFPSIVTLTCTAWAKTGKCTAVDCQGKSGRRHLGELRSLPGASIRILT